MVLSGPDPTDGPLQAGTFVGGGIPLIWTPLDRSLDQGAETETPATTKRDDPE